MLKILLFVTITQSCFAIDLSEAANKIAKKELGEKEWAKYVKNVQSRFNTWSSDNQSGNLKGFLDDKLLDIGASIKKSDIKLEDVKKITYWLAIYHEFKEPLPSYLTKESYEKELEELLENFSWEKVREILKKHMEKETTAKKD